MANVPERLTATLGSELLIRMRTSNELLKKRYWFIKQKLASGDLSADKLAKDTVANIKDDKS